MDVAIFGNGYLENLDFENINFEKMFIIGVDGGCNFLIKNNIKIDLAIGDFDSISSTDFLNSVECIEKTDMNYSDFEIAIDYCLKNNFKRVYLFGFTGKRSDHFLFNIRMIQKMFYERMEVFMIDEFNVITMIDDEKEFAKNNFKFFSVIPLFEDTNISITGAKYNLSNQKLKMISTLTLSNEWVEKKVKITVDKLVLVHLIF